MATLNEIQRVAAMANALRPEWRVDSLVTHLTANHGTRAYRDLAVAMAWICTDPDTESPGRLKEAGPWWDATTPKTAGTTSRNNGICGRCHYPHPASVPCDIRRADIDRDNPDRAAAREAVRAAARAAAHGTTEQENH